MINIVVPQKKENIYSPHKCSNPTGKYYTNSIAYFIHLNGHKVQHVFLNLKLNNAIFSISEENKFLYLLRLALVMIQLLLLSRIQHLRSSELVLTIYRIESSQYISCLNTGVHITVTLLHCHLEYIAHPKAILLFYYCIQYRDYYVLQNVNADLH